MIRAPKWKLVGQRLFVAVDLSDEVREDVATAARDLAERIASTPSAGSVRWVPPENLHLTLRFLGYVDEGRAPAVGSVLTEPLETAGFQASISGAGAFPPGGPPRVVWLAASEGGVQLTALHNEIEARLQPLGFKAETRRYTAHLTLGRVKAYSPGGGALFRRVLATTHVATSRWLVDHVTLYESKLSPKGPTYHPVVRTRLAVT